MMNDPFQGQFRSDDFNGEAAPISDAQTILRGLLSDLPDEAQVLVDKLNRDVAKIEAHAQDEAVRIRAEAEQKIDEVESRAENRRKALFQHVLEQLEPLQKDMFRAGELGKALATYVQIHALRARAQNVMADPGNLLNYQMVGKSFHFRVTGECHGPVWGTDIYTSDSHLATAAVHAGAVESGEEGVVRVSVVDMSREKVQGSFRNGVMTHDWGTYNVGYKVVRA